MLDHGSWIMDHMDHIHTGLLAGLLGFSSAALSAHSLFLSAVVGKCWCLRGCLVLQRKGLFCILLIIRVFLSTRDRLKFVVGLCGAGVRGVNDECGKKNGGTWHTAVYYYVMQTS